MYTYALQLSYAKCYQFAILTFRYLNYSITKLRKQDTLSVLVYVSQNVHGRYLAWNFARNNWNYISETLSYYIFITDSVHVVSLIPKLFCAARVQRTGG